MAAFEPFQALGEAYEKAANAIISSSINNLIGQLIPVITVGLALYVMITGYMVVAGRIQDPISDVLIKLSKWTIIAFLALNAGTITNYLIGGFNGLEQTILSGFNTSSDSIYSTLDESLEMGLGYAAEAINKNKKLNFLMEAGKMIYNYTLAVVIMLATLLQTFIAGAIIMLAKASLLVVFALAPLLLAGLFFPQTAKFADGWFNQCLNYVFTVVIAAFFLQIANQLFKTQLDAIAEGITSGNLSFIDLGKMLLLTVINFFVLKQAPNIAAGLAGGVASGSASLMGAARTLASVGSGIGAASKAAKSTIGNSYKAAVAMRHPILAAKHQFRRTATALNRINSQVIGKSHKTSSIKKN